MSPIEWREGGNEGGWWYQWKVVTREGLLTIVDRH